MDRNPSTYSLPPLVARSVGSCSCTLRSMVVKANTSRWTIEVEPSGLVVRRDGAWVTEESDPSDALAVVQRAGAESYTFIEVDGYETEYRASEYPIFDERPLTR